MCLYSPGYVCFQKVGWIGEHERLLTYIFVCVCMCVCFCMYECIFFVCTSMFAVVCVCMWIYVSGYGFLCVCVCISYWIVCVSSYTCVCSIWVYVLHFSLVGMHRCIIYILEFAIMALNVGGYWYFTAATSKIVLGYLRSSLGKLFLMISWKVLMAMMKTRHPIRSVKLSNVRPS